MKENWKIAQFKDVASVIGGSTPKTDVSEYWGGGNYWVSPAELDGSKYISSTVKTITDLAVAKSNLTLLPAGTVLLSSRAPIGKVAITTVPMYCNQGFKNIVCGPDLNNSYVYYFLKHNVAYLQSLGTGATFKEISKKVVETVKISYPSIEEQLRIVDELDLLTSIIDKKNAQLSDLDALAQSIFYEMFGDPVTNEKGWQTERLQKVAPKGAYLGEIPSVGEKHWLLNLDMIESQTGEIIDKVFFSQQEIGNSTSTFNQENVLFSKLRPYLNKVVLPDEPGYCTSELVPLAPVQDSLNRVFLAFLLRSTPFVNYIKGRVAGAKMPRVNMSDFWAFNVILPPLEEQLSFAEKAMFILENKRNIKNSIIDAEALLNSRMDYYFEI